ncbi:hypothetical protein HO173_002067 [Letharia columbiana]|uniref:Uncharacterized protein n=1 Tax=Letharia columbiana TaxID=112416 RepID=A0A8H6G2V1_9LECA|nr:uncharacterized protein HO173_002067 [Letharia columbiana]KAF6239523.1 hypothetical protein HO173_002067 [Letharia columbiana]
MATYTEMGVYALVSAAPISVEYRIQDGANSTNSRTWTQTCKFCIICNKDFHSTKEHPEWLKRKRAREESQASGNRGRGGRGGRGGKGGRGGGNINTESKPEKPKEEKD